MVIGFIWEQEVWEFLWNIEKLDWTDRLKLIFNQKIEISIKFWMNDFNNIFIDHFNIFKPFQTHLSGQF